MKKMKLGLVFGGRSGEHEVSCRSAEAILLNLHRDKYQVVSIKIEKDGKFDLQQILSCDVIFPIIHGTYGEDGSLQGLLEMYDKPYVGAGVLGSAVGMDKDVQKRLLNQTGITTARYQVVYRGDKVAPGKYPVFVKPANMGSSVGISRVKEHKDLKKALDLAFLFDTKVLIEQEVVGREMEMSVLGGRFPQASVAGEVIPSGHEFYDYEAKYIDETGASLIVPAKVTKQEMEEMKRIAIKAFQILDCYGMARVDMFLTETGVVLNEINTLPGFTSISMYPKLWEVSGLGFGALLDKLIELALRRQASRSKLRREYS
jgi:D-alanine-D-alanine ligase